MTKTTVIGNYRLTVLYAFKKFTTENKRSPTREELATQLDTTEDVIRKNVGFLMQLGMLVFDPENILVMTPRGERVCREKEKREALLKPVDK